MNFTFGQGSCLISDFARPNSHKSVLLQISLRFDIGISNNNVAFCVAEFLEPGMSSYRSISWSVGWFLLREIIKCICVLYPVCLKKYWKKLDKHLWLVLFSESCVITHHTLLKWIKHFARNRGKLLNELWKDKKIIENMKENLFQIIANELDKLPK